MKIHPRRGCLDCFRGSLKRLEIQNPVDKAEFLIHIEWGVSHVRGSGSIGEVR